MVSDIGLLGTRLFVFIPLAVIGLWRWGVWLAKVAVARRYEPVDTASDAVDELTVSAVTPVYMEDPDEFTAAVRSWIEAGADEVIAVIDHTDTDCIEAFKSLSTADDRLKLHVTETPGKRPALRDGAQQAEGDLIALIDSDVKWRPETLAELRKPFADSSIGAVTPKQIVAKQDTFARVLYECQMRLQFAIDYPALSYLGRSLSCLSGRTAIYRREALLPVINDLCEETFLGKPVISGDDKFLTRAVQANEWDIWYQSSAVIDIGAAADMRTLFSQTIRWTRNTIRSDLVSFVEGWVWSRRWLTYYTIDRFIATFAILLAPLYFAWSVASALYLAAGAILLWWTISRTMKLYPFLLTYPRRLWVVPFYTLSSFVMSPVRLYAFFSSNKQGWLTRGDDSRYGLSQLRQRAITTAAGAMTALTIGGFSYLVLVFRYG